jgi:hypothetical protein
MPKMTTEEAQAYFERWRLVRDVEVADLRRTSIDTKLRQLAALVAARDVFGQEAEREAQVRAVRARWALIRQALSG